MYYPLQIPNLLNTEFKEKIEYREYTHSDLENNIICIWTMHSYTTLKESLYNLILPDGCIDLIIDLEHKQIGFSAVSKATEHFELFGDVNYMGVRFRPGVFYDLFGYECHLVMDQFIAFEEIEKKLTLDEIFCTSDRQRQQKIVTTYLHKKIAGREKTTFSHLLETLNETPTDKCINSISDTLGYSKRQTNRIFSKHYGVSPKIVLNILRLHKSLHLLLQDKSIDLTDLAMRCGFYDQPHFIKEIKKYCGISPTSLIRKYKL